MSISNPAIQKTRGERLWTSSAARMARSSSTGMSSRRYLRHLPTATACSEARPRSHTSKRTNLAFGRRAGRAGHRSARLDRPARRLRQRYPRLRGDLAELATAWREAEEIAAIADDMFLPASVDQFIARHR